LKKPKAFSVIFVFLLIISAALALYPTISKMINTANANSTVENYSRNVDTMSKSEINDMFKEAERYNADLAKMVSTSKLPDFDPAEHYNDILNVTGNGIMGSVEIPSIKVRLPIYHGTDKEFLDEGAGHLIGTSFPIGGQNTHAIISAHTAQPGKQFFDKLTDLKEGDIFYISVLDRKLEYKVNDIQVVLPSESQSLSIVKGKDLVTLVTCTPYSINTHRLLVTGERVKSSDTITEENDKDATIDSLPTNSNGLHYLFILVGCVVLLVVLALIIIVSRRKKIHDEENESKSE
jgi:sortase A